MNTTLQKIVAFLVTIVLSGVVFPLTTLAYQAGPVAITRAATFVTEKSAKLNGQGNPNEVTDAQGWFEWGISGRPSVTYDTPHRALSGGARNTLFDVNSVIIGLAPSTQYFYRYVAESSRGKDVGQTVYFTTKARSVEIDPIVIIETVPPTAITTTTVELRGYVSPHGDTKTSVWFEWGTSQSLEMKTTLKKVAGSASAVVMPLKNLVPGTTYFYRAVAENNNGQTYGATRMFITAGTPPVTENAVTQNVQTPLPGGDGVERKVSTTGAGRTTGESELRPVGTYVPPSILGTMFRKKNTATTTQSSTTGAPLPAASGGTQSPLGSLWNNLSGKNPIQVTVQKVGPKTVPAHSPVEYLVTYVYGESAPASNVRLSVTFPKEVIYIGDNTANELMVEEAAEGARTYVLPLGNIKQGSTRSFSILGMTTEAAVGFPDVRAWLEYDTVSGTHVVEAMNSDAIAASSQALASKAKGGFLPSTLLGWSLYVIFIAAAIIGIRKAKEYYVKRKAELAREDDLANTPLGATVLGDRGLPH